MKLESIVVEISENWPALVYIGMTAVFSVFFFRERRAEARSVSERFDRLEIMVKDLIERP